MHFVLLDGTSFQLEVAPDRVLPVVRHRQVAVAFRLLPPVLHQTAHDILTEMEIPGKVFAYAFHLLLTAPAVVVLSLLIGVRISAFHSLTQLPGRQIAEVSPAIAVRLFFWKPEAVAMAGEEIDIVVAAPVHVFVFARGKPSCPCKSVTPGRQSFVGRCGR